MNYELADFVLVRAVTPLHPGVGRGGETADLPVQRDELDFPVAYSSSIKGALKSAVDRQLSVFLFGPEVVEEEKFSAPVAVLDAYLLAIPVRSLVGVYGYATSPVLLKRCKDYIDLVSSLSQAKGGKFQGIREAVGKLSGVSVGKGKVYVAREGLFSAQLRGKVVVVNEELWLGENYDGEVASSLGKLAESLGLERERLMLLSDEDMGRAVEKSLVRVTRVRLKRETKTVERGGLWTEEYVPRETVFYTVLLYSEPRVPDGLKAGLKQAFGSEEPKAEHVKGKLTGELGRKGNYLVIGGHETIGRGIVKLEFL